MLRKYLKTSCKSIVTFLIAPVAQVDRATDS